MGLSGLKIFEGLISKSQEPSRCITRFSFCYQIHRPFSYRQIYEETLFLFLRLLLVSLQSLNYKSLTGKRKGEDLLNNLMIHC